MKLSHLLLFSTLCTTYNPFLHAASAVPGQLTTLERSAVRVAAAATILGTITTYFMDKTDQGIAKRVLQRTKELTQKGISYPEVKATIASEFADTTWWQKAGWYAVAAVWAVAVLCAGGALWSMTRRGTHVFDATQQAYLAAQGAPFDDEAKAAIVRGFVPPIHPEIVDQRSETELRALGATQKRAAVQARIDLFSRLLARNVPPLEAAMALSGGRVPTTRNTQSCYAKLRQGGGTTGSRARGGDGNTDREHQEETSLMQQLEVAREQGQAALARPRFLYGDAFVKAAVEPAH